MWILLREINLSLLAQGKKEAKEENWCALHFLHNGGIGEYK